MVHAGDAANTAAGYVGVTNVRRGVMRRDVVRAASLPAAALTGIGAGALAYALGTERAHVVWMVALIATGTVVVARTLARMRRGQWASDIIAALAIVTAVVMGQPLAGLIVVLMQSGGEALERYAEGRASNAVRELEADAPRMAHVQRSGEFVDLPVGDIAVGELVLVRPGDLVPCDGVVVDGTASLDTSRLTGESIPREIEPGSHVESGSINENRPFVMRATAIAQASQYARIVELVRTAQASKAPFQRVADRYAVWFTPITLIVAALAALVSHDLDRVLAILVVATPCPLILAPPIAIIGGINRAARRQIIVRDGGAVERLATVDTLILDKTGTLTIGKPAVETIIARPPFSRDDILRLAGSVEQRASHLLARTLVDAAQDQGVSLLPVTKAVESPGLGMMGIVDGCVVAIGARSFISESVGIDDRADVRAERNDDALAAYVAIDARYAGVVRYADALRVGVDRVLERFRGLGVHRTMLLSGDDEGNVRSVASRVGIDDMHGDLRPEDKVREVRALTESGRHTLMIGDGTNDAPALSAATVGIALAGHGGGVSAEAADIVILVDDLGRAADALQISRRTMRIARQSVWTGLTLSGVAMGFAALGHIVPITGAVLQELIDVGVILNALRASIAPRARPAADRDVSPGFSDRTSASRRQMPMPQSGSV